MLLERLGSLFQPDPNEPKGYATKDEIAERRKMARQLMQQGTSTAPIANGWEGLSRILGSVNGAVQDYQAKREDRDAYSEARKREAALFGGDPTAPASPAAPMSLNPAAASASAAAPEPNVGGGGMRSPGMAGVIKSTDPVAAGLKPHEAAFLNGVAGPESAGKYNVRYTPQGGAIFGSFDKHPGIFEAGPHGRSSAAGRYQFTKTTWDGLPTEAKGDGKFTPENQDRAALFLARRDYQAKTGRDDFDVLLQTPGGFAKVAQSLQGTWRGFADNPAKAVGAFDDTLRRFGPGVQSRPPAQPVNAPSGPVGTPWAGMTPEAANAMRRAPEAAAAAPQQAAAPQAPVQMAQAPQAAPAASGGPSMGALMSIMNDERASPGAKAAAQLMLQRRIASENKDPTAAALQQEQLRAAQRNNREAENAMETQVIGGNLYERRKGTTDTWKLSIKKADEDATPKRSLQPIYGVDAEGNTVLLQPDDAGNANQMRLPAGVKVTPGTQRVDTGTEILTVDTKTGNVIGRVKKDVAGVEVQKTIGEAQGKVAAAAPNAIGTAEQTLKDIEGIKKHPSMSDSFFGGGLGAPGTVFRSIPGTQAYGFNQRIEQLKGKTFMEAYNGLRGGGAITDAEGAKATQALGRLNAAQSAKDFNEALSDLENVVKSGLERAKGMGAKFGTTPTDGAPAASAAPNAAPQASSRPRILSVEPVQ